MTVEERAHELITKIFSLPSPGPRDRQVLAPVIVEAFRDQAEEFLKVVNEEVAARRKALKEASRRNSSYDFRGHSDAIIAAETIARNIRALSGIPVDDGPDDRFDLGGFECNEKEVE